LLCFVSYETAVPGHPTLGYDRFNDHGRTASDSVRNEEQRPIRDARLLRREHWESNVCRRLRCVEREIQYDHVHPVYVSVEGRLVFVALRNGVYCTGGRNGKWQPLSPQPSATDIIKAHRHYATLQADVKYRKRVTWFSNLPGADNKAVVRTSLDSAVSSTEVRLSSGVVISSDEEKGLTKALRDVFSESTHLLCVKHLRHTGLTTA